jgi:hypothetical protein
MTNGWCIAQSFPAEIIGHHISFGIKVHRYR